MTLRLVMMGTGRFALPTFRELYGTSHEIVGLFTQPDRHGKGHHDHVNPMKQLAEVRNTPVFQPERINLPDGLVSLRELKPDLCVVAAYGQILSAELLSIPKRGAINVHASLLPKYRGAAPIQYALWNGETETGITVFHIHPQLDAGPILGTVSTPIDAKETYGELELRLADLAVPLTLNVIEQIDSGTSQPLMQDASAVTKAPRLKKEQGEIVWSKESRLVDCHVRAMQPWPKPYSYWHHDGRQPLRVIVLEIDPLITSSTPGQAPGTVTQCDGKRLFVQTGDGEIEILQIQPEGKRAMKAEEFLRGYPVAVGDRFGSQS
ncbi:MAG: methionyl-tRNA formyltransferase [Planctomycetota bacterium]|nr:methionyl-tRNA formyltransferase [Planctomycetota bacterium]MDA1211357.1 methionyl-tRNA formyltransferase [Planctomycetota bacterium]